MKVCTEADAALYEALVVPRYDALLAKGLLERIEPRPSARVAHLACRTGYPGEHLLARLPHASRFAVDSSAPALALARAKALGSEAPSLEAVVESSSRGDSLPSASFTHVLSLHPLSIEGGLDGCLDAARRLLAPGAQLLFAIPLGGSFPELRDLLREYAVRYEDESFLGDISAAFAKLVSPEVLERRLESFGFEDASVSVDLVGVLFASGQAFLDDPLRRLVLAAEIAGLFGEHASAPAAWEYAGEAARRYFADTPLRVSLNLGYVTARRG